MMHKTYLVLGSFPKFHIESFGEAFFGGTRTFGILMLNVLRGTFIFSWCFLALEPWLRGTVSSLSIFPVPSGVAIMCGSFFWTIPRPK